jgi:hypothetical protein
MNFIPREFVKDFPVEGLVSAAIREWLIANRVEKLKTIIQKVIFFMDNLLGMIVQLIQFNTASMNIRTALLRPMLFAIPQ